MDKVKGRVLHLQSRLQGSAASKNQNTPGRLRGNELYRLMSIINKVKWKRKLTPADEHDLEEIEAIDQGRHGLVRPELRFFPPAVARHDQEGRVCWFQGQDTTPLRPLTEAEQALWKRVGPTGFHGYLRLDGAIQAYELSGCEDSDIPWAYPDQD